MEELIQEVTGLQKTLFDHWAGKYWADVERTMGIFKEWGPEFYTYTMRRAKSVAAATIMDYQGGEFVSWAVGTCLNVFHVEWNALSSARQKEVLFTNAVNSINVKGILVKYGCQPELIDDMEQEVRLRVWMAFDRYDPRKGQFLTWVYAIARNAVYDLGRKRVRTGEGKFMFVPMFPDLVVEGDDDPIGELMDVMADLEARGQLALVRSIQAYLNGECDMPDPTKIRELLGVEGCNA